MLSFYARCGERGADNEAGTGTVRNVILSAPSILARENGTEHCIKLANILENFMRNISIE